MLQMMEYQKQALPWDYDWPQGARLPGFRLRFGCLGFRVVAV